MRPGSNCRATCGSRHERDKDMNPSTIFEDSSSRLRRLMSGRPVAFRKALYFFIGSMTRKVRAQPGEISEPPRKVGDFPHIGRHSREEGQRKICVDTTGAAPPANRRCASGDINSAETLARRFALVFAALLCAPLMAASAYAQDYGDISVKVETVMEPRSSSGYDEFRVTIINRSLTKSHRVTVVAYRVPRR